MPRQARVAPGGLLFHVLNRSVARLRLFKSDQDFQAFENLLIEAHARHPIRLISYCVMSTHWHFVVHPAEDGELTAFFRWLTHTHAMRWRVGHRTVGYGPVYQGRFKSFPVQRDEHLLALCRYVERNPLSAGMVRQAEQWRWCSLWARGRGSEQVRSILSEWPVDRPADWVRRVNRPMTAKELERIRLSLSRGRPFGEDRWVQRTAQRLDLEHTLRSEGRPRRRQPAIERGGSDGV